MMNKGSFSAEPLMAWLNPLLVVELRRRLRKWMTFLAFAAPVVFFIAAAYYQMVMKRIGVWAPFGAMPTPQETGRELFEFFVYCYMFVALFIMPAVTAGSICRERELGTLEMLRLSRLSSFDIIGGKFLAGISYIVLILIAPLPAIFLSRVFGGFSTEEILKGTALTLAWSTAFGLASLFFSSFLEKTRTALVASYGFLAVWLWATHSLTQFNFTLGPQWSSLLQTLRMTLNPFVALEVTYQTYNASNITIGPINAPTWVISILAALALASVCALLAPIFMKLPFSLKALLEKRRRRSASRFDPLVGSRNQPLLDRFNIVFQRDIRANRSITRMAAHGWFAAGALLVVAIYYVAYTFYPNTRQLDEVVLTLFITLMSIIGLLILVGGCVAGALTLVTERENGTLESLRMTELNPEEIVRGKFWAAFCSRALPIGFLVPIAVGITLSNAEFWITVPVMILTIFGLLLGCAVGASLGINASVNAKKATSAMVSSIITFGAWAVAMQFALMILNSFLMLFGLLIDGLMRRLIHLDLETLFNSLLPGDGIGLAYLMGAFNVLFTLIICLLTLRAALRSASTDLSIRMGRTSRYAKSRKARKMLGGNRPMEADEQEWRPKDTPESGFDAHHGDEYFPVAPSAGERQGLPRAE